MAARRAENVEDRINFRIERRLPDYSNPLELPFRTFRRRYRVRKDTMRVIADHAVDQLRRETNRSFALPVIIGVAVSIHYLATGSFQSVVGDVHGVVQSTVCTAIWQFMDMMVARVDEVIRWPEPEQWRAINEKFKDIAGIPNVIGCIDGTQIKLFLPKGRVPHPEVFICRKGFSSLNIQAICGPDRTIYDIVARWPGSVHDSRILRNSRVPEKFETGELRGFLLGDLGYPLQTWLLTPFLDPVQPDRVRYNHLHSATRMRIEQAFGIAKRRFAIMHIGLRLTPDRAVKVIVTSFMLHNICIAMNDPYQVRRILVDDDDDIYEGEPEFPAVEVRDRIVQILNNNRNR